MVGACTFTVVVSSDSRYVYVDLADTGKGMSPSLKKKFFESGFSPNRTDEDWGCRWPKGLSTNTTRVVSM